MTSIGLSLPEEYLEHVKRVPTAKQMWRTILDVFKHQNLLKKLSTRRKLYTATMLED